MSETRVFQTETRSRREVSTSCEIENQTRREIKQFFKTNKLKYNKKLQGLLTNTIKHLSKYKYKWKLLNVITLGHKETDNIISDYIKRLPLNNKF